MAGLLACVATCQAALGARAVALAVTSSPQPAAGGQDQLLTAEEAAIRLGLSTTWLYRHARTLPFTVRIGRTIRFSASGIERYVRQRTA